MYRAEISIVILKYMGMCPSASLGGISRAYNAYSIVVVIVLTLLTMSNIIYVLVKKTDAEEFVDNFCYGIGIFLSWVKLMVVFTNRDEIIETSEILLNKHFAPRDNDEFIIQNVYDSIGRTGTIIFASLVWVLGVIKTSIPVVRGDLTHLPYQGWFPYNLENRTTYWLTFFFQILGTSIGCAAAVASDSYIISMMLQLCAQIEIVMHRIKIFVNLCKTEFLNCSNDQQLFIVDWVQHHDSLYDFQKKLNDIFGLFFFFQLFLTAFEVCTATYLLATYSVTSIKFWAMLLAMGFFMSEVYIFCLHGHLVMEKSREIGHAVFSTDWTSLSSKSRKSFIFILERTITPILFTCGLNVPLSIDSFTVILRTAYSIYNCLNQRK